MVELYYLSGNKVILFKCDWYDVINIGKGIKIINMDSCVWFWTNHIHKWTICACISSKTSLLCSIFNWHKIAHRCRVTNSRGLWYELGSIYWWSYQQPITLHSQHYVHDLVENDLINWHRNDIVGETIYTNVLLSPQGNIVEREWIY